MRGGGGATERSCWTPSGNGRRSERRCEDDGDLVVALPCVELGGNRRMEHDAGRHLAYDAAQAFVLAHHAGRGCAVPGGVLSRAVALGRAASGVLHCLYSLRVVELGE